MKQYKLSEEEQKQIAHFIAQRSIKSQPLEISQATREYIESYNKALNELKDYNSNTTE